jgi:APA family basic amino acid/polyamine antiporter
MNDVPETQEVERRLPGTRIIRRRRGQRAMSLPRVLGVSALFSTAYGNVGSSIYYALGVTAMYALGMTPVVFVIAGAIFWLTAMTYAEGTAAFPEAGGASSFARHAFNEFVSFFAGWAQILNYIITISISAFSVPNYMAGIAAPLAFLGVYPWNAIGGVIVVLGLIVLNVIGIRETALVNIVLAFTDLVTQALLVVLGAILLFSPKILLSNVHWGIAPTPLNFLYGISIAMIAYTGIETISNMAEEVRRPARDIPRSIKFVFLAVILMYTAIPLVALSAMPVEEVAPGEYATALGDEYKNDPVMGIAKAGFRGKIPDVYTDWIMRWIGLLAGIILVIATNAGIIGLSRLTFSMGHHVQLPPLLGRVHKRFRTPYVSIIVFSLIAAAVILPGRIDLLAALYSFGAMLSFTIAHVSIAAMRVRRPGLDRPFTWGPTVRIRGRGVPITAILGAFFTGSTWAIVVGKESWGMKEFGFGWLAIGIIIYVVYRRRAGLGLYETVTRSRRRRSTAEAR